MKYNAAQPYYEPTYATSKQWHCMPQLYQLSSEKNLFIFNSLYSSIMIMIEMKYSGAALLSLVNYTYRTKAMAPHTPVISVTDDCRIHAI